MQIEVTVAGRRAPQIDETLSESLVLPLAMLGSALGLDACWDARTCTLHLASPLQGRVVVLDTVAAAGCADDLAGEIDDLGQILAAELEGWGARVGVRNARGAMGAHTGSWADLVLMLAPGGRRSDPPGPGARWGWAEAWRSRSWAQALVRSVAEEIELVPRGARGQLPFWRHDYPPDLRWGGSPAVVLEPVNTGTEAGRRILKHRPLRERCAQGMVAGLKAIFARYLPPAARAASGMPGTVDYWSLESLWSKSDGSGPAGCDAPGPGTERGVRDRELARGEGRDSPKPASSRRRRVRDITAIKRASRSQAHSGLAANISRSGDASSPRIPGAKAEDVFTCLRQQRPRSSRGFPHWRPPGRDSS